MVTGNTFAYRTICIMTKYSFKASEKKQQEAQNGFKDQDFVVYLNLSCHIRHEANLLVHAICLGCTINTVFAPFIIISFVFGVVIFLLIHNSVFIFF